MLSVVKVQILKSILCSNLYVVILCECTKALPFEDFFFCFLCQGAQSLEISETAQILKCQYLVALYSTFTRALTFEKRFFLQGRKGACFCAQVLACAL